MSIRCGLFSDVDLEFRFKHMTSKQHSKYLQDQIINLEKLSDLCIKKKLDALFIVGNIFGTVKPKNKSIEQVNKFLTKVSKENVTIFILPGTRDTPLYFSNDNPVHFIFENIENVKIIPNAIKSDHNVRIIEEPTFKGDIQTIPIEIFTTPNNLVQPDQFKFNFNCDKGRISIFILSDITSFKKDTLEIYENTLKNLNKTDIDLFLIGGNIPKIEKKIKSNFKLINCPPIHHNSFIFKNNNEFGLKIIELSKSLSKALMDPNSKSKSNSISKLVNESEIIPISNFKVIRQIVDLGNIGRDNLNFIIENSIKEHSNRENTILQLKLVGIVPKKDYQAIKLFHYIDMGKRLNYYFELSDNIEFSEASEGIEALKILNEINHFKDKKIQEIRDNDDYSPEEIEEEIEVLNDAYNLIKQDWNNMEGI